MQYSHFFTHLKSRLFFCILLAGASTGAFAQKQQVTSIFSEPLSLQTLGPIKNMDTAAGCLLRQAPDGHLIVIGAETRIVCPRGHFIEMLPKTKIIGFNAVTLNVYENGMATQSFGLEASSGIPMIRIDPPVGQVNRKRIDICLYDPDRRRSVVQTCILSASSTDVAPTVTTSLQSEMFSIKTGGDMIECRLNGLPLGKLIDSMQPALLDARRLPPGHYSLESFPHTTNNVLLEPIKSEFDITPRYTLVISHDNTPIHLGSPLDPDKVDFQVSVHSAARIVKTRVYVSGELVGEYSKPDFVVSIPIKPIPSGKTTFDVIGIAADGTHYAVESCPTEIKNEIWESEIYGTKDYMDLQAKLAEIAANKAQVEMWYEKFAHTPLTTKVGVHTWDVYQTATLFSGSGWKTYFEDVYAPTGSIKYKQNADKYLQLMAHGYLETGKLHLKLRMRQEARRDFQTVVTLLGETTPDGIQAKALMHELAIPD